ncbi:MAG: hypothetical protein RMK80_00270 [Pseudobdellovibrionaceae bacterium]|nr:hypothetical protein [Pseudobdellovibrionaceae bacterium]
MAVYFSAKITNTLLSYGEAQGLDLAELFFEWPWAEGTLTDPGQWILGQDLEVIISDFMAWWSKKKGTIPSEDAFLREVAHSSFNHRAWGTLDSVLRMMPDVFEAFERPHVLLGHFVSPAPNIHVLSKSKNLIVLSWENAPLEYPKSFAMVLHSLEVLPKYLGWHSGNCRYEHGKLIMTLNQKDHNLPSSAPVSISSNHPSHPLVTHQLAIVESNEEALFHSLSLSREIFRELVSIIEKPSNRNRKKLKPGKEELPGDSNMAPDPDPVDKTPLQLPLSSSPHLELTGEPSESDLDLLQQNLSRILDFFVRATQLVTLMSQQSPERSKKWMRRLNWQKVLQDFPGLVEDSAWLIKRLKKDSYKKSLVNPQEDAPCQT